MRFKTKMVILLVSVFLSALAFNMIAAIVYVDKIELAECSDNEILSSCIAKAETEPPECPVLQKNY